MAQFKDIITFTEQGGMNSDDDVRTIPKNDVLLLLNGRWGVSYANNVNAIEKIIGNSRVNITLPDGFNKVIGFTEDIKRKAGIYAIYNTKGNHCIIRFNIMYETLSVIVWGLNKLEFTRYGYLDMDIAYNDDEGLLYFTDGLSSIKKLNIMKARLTTNKTYNSGIGVWIIEDDFIVQQ